MRVLVFDVLVSDRRTGQDRTVRIEADDADTAQRAAAELAGVAGPAVLAEVRRVPDPAAGYAALEERLRGAQTQLARMQETLEAINSRAIMRRPVRIIGSAVAYGMVLASFLVGLVSALVLR